MADRMLEPKFIQLIRSGRAGKWARAVALAGIWLACAALGAAQRGMSRSDAANRPPRVIAAERFLAERGWTFGHRLSRPGALTKRSQGEPYPAGSQSVRPRPQDATGAAATWQPLGPSAVETANFGLVTGRITALSLDPADLTGNHLYVGTTGGGVWEAENAAVSTPSLISFIPLTDAVPALAGAMDASISIGALTVQPGGTGVILAGTGDPNDVLDSYYGTGILRSTDGGSTWSLVQQSVDREDGLGAFDASFLGEGFAGFAWSTVNPQLVVAAVSQAYEGTLVNAVAVGASLEGLYYSTDSGASWHLATITDGNGDDVQGPLDAFPAPDGNAATAVVWNQVRQLFIAAVRFHGYYQSADGVTWTRMTAQPGSGLTSQACPNNIGSTGSIACPIFRGALAVNPQTGDTFAWTVDLNNQDQGLWQDECAQSAGACASPSLTFGQQWNTAALEENTPLGAVTIANGNYNLVLAAVPSQQETLLLAGANDLWETTCPVAQGCSWRNTTNSTTCMSAQVGEFQHALTWNAANPLEILIGNDSGLWRSMDAIGETGPACSATDASHFQNLNAGLGSLAEPQSLSQIVSSPYFMMAGLGVNGTAGVKNTAAIADWPQILSGYGGPVAIDPKNTYNWYVNDQAGVAIYLCSQSSACTPADFGSSPVVTNADVGGDGDGMATPAAFLVDPLDPTQLLIGTCRVWRGPANGIGWSAGNAISPILDSGATTGSCNGDALIRSIAAMPLANGGEIVYVGMYGALDGGANLQGHVLVATIDAASGLPPVWQDLTLNPVTNDTNALNAYGLDISSVFIDPHDTTGDTVYVTVAGIPDLEENVQTIYRSTNGGADWMAITANLPPAPSNSVVVDPQNANTVYIATDDGVYFTTQAASCAQSISNCWSAFGTGLPLAPVVALAAAPLTASAQVLAAATYGRGIWQAPLWTAGTSLTTAATSPTSLTFPAQISGTASAPQTVTVQNTGSIALAPTSIAVSGDFNEIDNCVNASVAPGASCSIQVTFTPGATGPLTGQMTIYVNVDGGQITVDLSGTGTPAGAVSLSPVAVDFGQVADGSTSAALPIQVANASASTVPINSIAVAPPFTLASNACGTISLAANADCQLEITFAPMQPGPVTGLLTFTDGAGIQTVELSGDGAAPPTDIVSPASLTFPGTAASQVSAAQPVTITNNGDLALTSISVAVSAQFQAASNCDTQLAAHSVCTVSVEFAPSQVGGISGMLTITDALRTQTISLSGTGLIPAAFAVTPTALTFTQQQPGTASAPETVTITNSGVAPMANIGFQLTGPAASSYSIGATTCGALLNNGSNCTVQIVFTPAATGPIAATLAISSSTPGVAAVSVPINGAGQLATGLAANPAQLPFTTVTGVGQVSPAQIITITNSSSYGFGSVTLAATGPFAVTQNTCTGGLDAGAHCSASVVFQPSAVGAATGTLTISSPVVTTPASVSLSGTGFDFTLTPSGPAGATVASGQQADYTLDITPNGAEGAFTFQCGSLPANATCVFNPSTESLPIGTQGNVEVEIFTGSSGPTARIEGPAPRRELRDIAPLACGLLLLPLALWKRRKGFLLVALAVSFGLGVSSCTSSGGGTGGGGGGQNNSSQTPAGSYTIPVTVTSTGVSHSVNLSLTVD